MAAADIIEPLNPNPNYKNLHSRPRRVCFSFAAYAKNVIENLRASNIPVAGGLTDNEFAAVESIFNFTFPPDLRSFLREGLPVGPDFPNWRSSSAQQLQILVNFPILGLCKEVSKNRFWAQSWGEKPKNIDEAVKLAKAFLKKAPVLVPIYRHCYIPCTPNLSGNPIFYIHDGDVQLLSFDIAGFFQQVDFRLKDGVNRRPSLSNLFNLPVWAATEARRIEFWTDAAARGNKRWWRGDLVGCMEGVWWRLRDGGWREEEVREMMMMMDDGDEERELKELGEDREEVAWHVRVLSVRLLRAGWSREDVVESLGCQVESGEVESWLDFRHTGSNVLEVV